MQVGPGGRAQPTHLHASRQRAVHAAWHLIVECMPLSAAQRGQKMQAQGGSAQQQTRGAGAVVTHVHCNPRQIFPAQPSSPPHPISPLL